MGSESIHTWEEEQEAPISDNPMHKHDVKTTARFVQWEVDCFGTTTDSTIANRKESKSFTMGIRTWYLALITSDGRTRVVLFANASSQYKKNTYLVLSASMKLLSSPPKQMTIAHLPGVIDKPLEMDFFSWSLDKFIPGRFLIEIKFVDLKISNGLNGVPVSIWPSYKRKSPEESTWSGLAHMLQEDILTDITINTMDGSIRAHIAVLAARSPVFRKMFSHNLKEKELSSVDISDMSFDECQAFINHMYDNLREEDFLTHRLALLGAADKYDVPDLKEACHTSLLHDVDMENLLDWLQVAHLYQLPALKMSCIRLLVDFGKVYEIYGDFKEFIETADSDLIVEILKHARGRSTSIV